VTVIERMDLFPSVPRAALPRPCYFLHGRPAAKSTPHAVLLAAARRPPG